MNYIILNGNDSRNIKGLMIQALPPITKPAMRSEIEEIDGRDGDIITPLGYAAYDKTLSIGLYGEYDVDEVIEFFNSSGVVTFSNEPDKVYNYEVLNQIDFEKLIRYKTADVVFHVQPFKFSIGESAKTFQTSPISGEGTIVTLSPTATGEFLTSFRLYGNAVQQSTPSLTRSVDIKQVHGNMYVVFDNGTERTTAAHILLTGYLGKLNNYQDVIYKSGDIWYEKKATGTYRVQPLIDGELGIVDSYTNVTYITVPKPIDSAAYGNYQNVPILFTHAPYSYGLNEGWDSVNCVDKIFSQADAKRFWIGFPKGTTLAQAQTALSGGCVILYPLLKTTTQEITDDTLIDSLNGVLETSLFDGSTIIYTNIEIQNAQVPIAVKFMQQVFSIYNTGNIYSRPKITIYGTGIVTISVNGQQIFTVNMNGEDYITIDGAAMEAYNDTGLKNRLVTGNYDNFIFKVGKNTIASSGSVTQMIVENYSRWL